MTDTNTKPCPECDGTGRCEYEKPVIDYMNGGFLDMVMDVCEECSGSGQVEDDGEEDEIDF
jgi:DnaJ-class molecular chaperone